MEIRKFANEKKRTVVVHLVFEHGETALFDIVKQYYEKQGVQCELGEHSKYNPLSSYLWLEENIFEARATCHPDDEWDEERGYQLALKRAWVKYHKWVYQELRDGALMLFKLANIINQPAEDYFENVYVPAWKEWSELRGEITT